MLSALLKKMEKCAVALWLISLVHLAFFHDAEEILLMYKKKKENLSVLEHYDDKYG